MPAVDILLSTFDGARWLDAQLESLLAQTERGWRLHARDDGSRDGTVALLEAWARRDERIVLHRDGRGRLGACQSFGALLEARVAAGGAGPIMFCDQDDVWLPHKVARSLDALRGASAPSLVCSDLTVVDRDLAPIAASHWRHVRRGPRAFELRALLSVNVVVGCTVAIDRALAALAVPVPPAAVMHDWWLALVAARVGRIVPIEEPLVLYRQHGANRYGAHRRSLAGYARRLLDAPAVLADQRRAIAQARELSRRHGGGLGALDVLRSKAAATIERIAGAARDEL